MKTISFILTIFILTSCKTILIKSYGIKQPVVENEKSLRYFLQENQISDTIQVYVLKDLNSYYSTMKNASLPDAKFFNKNGNFVDYKLSPSDCNAQVGPFIENSQNINDLPFNNSIQLREIIKDLVDIHTKNTIELDKNADGYLVLYWAKFIGGKLNRKKSLDWIKVYNESQKKGANIQLIFLNLDYQDFWGITNEDIPEYDF